jgi:outer membrane protein assembly factor BamB
MPVKIDGVDQLLAFGNAGRKQTKLIAVDPKDGKTLWVFDGWGCRIPIASPAHAGNGKVLLTGGYGAGSVMIQVSRDAAGNWATEELWRLDRKEAGSQICDALVWEGHIYIDNNENGKNNGMVCVDLEGDIKWSSNQPNCNRGGQIIADGMMYKLDGRNGALYLVRPTPEKFDVVSEATGLLNPGELWAPLAISKGRLIIRDHGQLKCLDVR